MTAVRPVVVVGAGLAGLAAAHRLTELDVPVQVLEASTRVGGIIATERADGFVMEWGADSFLTEKPWGLALCHRLGLEDQLIGTRETRRRTYVVHDRRLHPLPEGFMLMAPTALGSLLGSSLFSWSGKLRMACDLVLPRRSSSGTDESLAGFVTRRLGREALERAVQPLVGGIYTADPERLSLAATMPRFLEMERRDRSLILALRRQALAAARQGSGARWTLFASFRTGMQTLVDALVARLPAGAIRTGARVVGLTPAGESGWCVVLEDGEMVPAASVIVATPSFHAAALLRPLDPGLAGELDAIRHASSAIVTLAYARDEIPHPLDGFGFVVPAVERSPLIAGSFSSIKFAGRAPEGMVLLRAFCGGALAAHVLECTDDELVETVRAELDVLLGVRARPHLVRVRRFERAMPQYDVGHLDRVTRIESATARHAGLALAGNAYRGVGIPDCVHSGEQAAEYVAQA